MLNEKIVSKEFLEHYSNTENWFNYPEFYKKLAEEPKFETYVEVGVWKGHSLSHLVQCLQKTGKEFVVYAVDLWDKLDKANELWISYPEQMPFLRHIYNYNLMKTNTRKDVFDFICDSSEAAAKFKDDTVDVCFLDASHDEDSVLKDLIAWYPKIREGGILCGHDIHSPSVQLAVVAFFNKLELPILVNEDKDVWAVHIKRN